jgi:hypothetical protein
MSVLVIGVAVLVMFGFIVDSVFAFSRTRD